MKNNAYLSKIKDNTRKDRRRDRRGYSRGGGKGGRGGGGGFGASGGGGGHFGNGYEQGNQGFFSRNDSNQNSFNDNLGKNLFQNSGKTVFNEFKGIGTSYAYEIKTNKEISLLNQPNLPASSAPPSFLELSASGELQTKKTSDIASPEIKSSCLERVEPTTPVVAVKTVKSEQVHEIKKSIKKEKPDVPIAQLKNVKVEQKSPPDSPSEDESSSEESSSSEEVPAMPKPMQTTVKPKKERQGEDDVVCLGKQSNFENLVDDDDSDKKPCLVCKSEEHTAEKCQMNCIKCSHSSYTTNVICNNCGETYPPSVKPPNAPNPFHMFMQFMQFCMSQYTDIGNDISQQFPGPLPVQGSTKDIEITRQDIADTKHRKKSKSESKKSRKKKKSERSTDSDSDFSSKANTSVKKRKKLDSAQPTPPVLHPIQDPKQIRKKKKSENNIGSESDSSSKTNLSVKKRKKPDSSHATPAVVQPTQQSKQIRKKKKSTSTSDSDSDSSSKANTSIKKRKKADTAQQTPTAVQPTQQSKQNRKKKKSESSSDSDSDSSSSKATATIKKRKKPDTVLPTPANQPHFSGAFPNNVPFAGGFRNPGYNPMLAFTQMMGYNPTTMNFPG